MTTPNLSEEQAVILGLGAKKRLAYMFETVQQFKQVWILNDNDGCVMLANEVEEDDLLIAAFPTEEDDGTILFSDEFEKQLKAPKKKY